MFTVMHQRSDGSQELFTAVSVQHIPASEMAGNSAGVHLLCGPDEGGPGIKCGHLKDGTIFVMNDKGATIGQFNLNAPRPQPA